MLYYNISVKIVVRRGNIVATSSAHNHDRCVEAALAAADAVCRRRGVRLTPIRRRVLELVWSGHSAVKAYDIIEAFADGRATKPPTVYRALDFLMEQGLVHRIECLNAFVGCSHPEAGHDSHFLICENCATVTELDAAPVKKVLAREADAAGFEVDRHTVEVQGLCRDCRAA